jgi:hypothetical protein
MRTFEALNYWPKFRCGLPGCDTVKSAGEYRTEGTHWEDGGSMFLRKTENKNLM